MITYFEFIGTRITLAGIALLISTWELAKWCARRLIDGKKKVKK